MTADLHPDRLLDLVRRLAAELRPGTRDYDALGLDHRLERDFGLDSLARVELVARIEREFGRALAATALAEAETPRDLLHLLAATGLATEKIGAGRTALADNADGAERACVPDQIDTLIAALEWQATATGPGSQTHMILLDDAGAADEVSYARLLAAARRVAAGLIARGVAPGDRVALMLPTGLDFFAAFHGALHAGAVPVPLYPPARPAQLEEHMRRVAGIIASAGAVWLITDPRARLFADVLTARCPALGGAVTAEELSRSGELAAAVPRQAADIAFLQYTSGSTGEPKGVMLTHANLLANIRAMRLATGAQARDTFVSWLPLYHDMGLIGAGLGSLVVGFCLVLMSPLAFLARPRAWLEAIDRYRGTLSAAPNFAYELCASRLDDRDLAGLDLSSWRLTFNGAEPVSPATLERFAARCAPLGLPRTALAAVYGLAECAVGLCFPPSGRGPRIDTVERRALQDAGDARAVLPDTPGALKVVGCGQPLAGHGLRIVDAHGRELPERRVGRVQFTGPSATAGYFNNAAATAKLVAGEWRNTGDLGYLAEGELFLTGREKDIIIRAGHNIHPQELEEAIGNLEGVRRGGVAVFPTRDEASGTERLVVLAETRADAAACRHIRAEIDRLAIDLIGTPADDIVLAPPRTVLKTSSGKIRRTACREAYERGTLLAAARAPVLQAARLAASAAMARLRRLPVALVDALWGAWACIVFGTLVAVFWPLIVLLPGSLLPRRVARIGARLTLRLTGLAPRVAGLEHLAAPGPHILVANHASYLDGLVLAAALPPHFAYVAKEELLGSRFAAAPLKRLGTLFVARADAVRGIEDTQAIAKRLAQGEALVFFAEGTFREAPGLLPFRLGAFQIAARTGAAVLPVTLSGTRRLLPGERRWPRFVHLAVTIDAPLMPSGREWEGALALRAAARACIAARVGEPSVE